MDVHPENLLFFVLENSTMLENVFEEVYVINMPRRTDRWEQFSQQLPEDWPFKKPVRYEALDGGIVSPPAWWNGGAGAWGCYRTHLRILEDCMNQNISTVLILEDDAVCVEGFREKVELFWSHLPKDWEMVYLGGQHIQENLRLPRKLNEWVYMPFNVNRCHCYGFRGRKMLEKAYRHLNNVFDWKVDHHVDHYLGELHKTMEHGLYAPREWLLAQSEGQSDISGEKLELRLFPSAEEIVYPVIHSPGIALVGTYFSGINTLAGVMQHLGLFLGGDIGTPQEPNSPHFFEDAYLGEICRACYSEPWLFEQVSFLDRTNHLRRWGGMQCQRKPEQTSYFCGKHPILSLMGKELMEAWNRPKIICMDRPDEESYKAMQTMPWAWHPTAAKYSFETLRIARETFFAEEQPDLLRLSYEQMKSDPVLIVLNLCKFLGISPSGAQKERAIEFMKTCENDLCYT